MDTSRDRAMILDPYKWPLFYLPLKRSVQGGGMPEIALLRSASTEPDVERTVEINMSVYGPLGDVTTVKYSTVDELLADGWVVD
jgi:hypothetical protein